MDNVETLRHGPRCDTSAVGKRQLTVKPAFKAAAGGNVCGESDAEERQNGTEELAATVLAPFLP